MADKKQMVIGVFRERLDAEQAFEGLLNRGYADRDISVLMSETTHKCFYFQDENEEGKHQVGSMATEGMGVGGAVGTAVGATIAAILAIGTSIVIPGIGIIAGPIAAALAGGGAGAVSGGLLGALVGWGIPEQNAKAYDAVIREGGVVLGVHPGTNDEAREVEKLYKECNGENVHRA